MELARYELALGAYRRGDGPAARCHFAGCLDISPEDEPTLTMLERIETLAATSTMPAPGAAFGDSRKTTCPSVARSGRRVLIR
jgi:hypothetical protein